jgi:hypothetical protein
MQRCRLLTVLALGFACNLSSFHALAATPGFTLTATGVTESSSGTNGTGLSNITLTSVDGYTGIVQVVCDPPTPPSGVKIPFCNNGPIADPSYTLTANQSVTGKMGFYNDPLPVGVVSLRPHRSPGPVPVLALAGMLLWGIARRRKAAKFFTLILFAAVSLLSVAGMSACGGSSSAVTPGTYVYTFTATDAHGTVVTAPVNVTVP